MKIKTTSQFVLNTALLFSLLFTLTAQGAEEEINLEDTNWQLRNMKVLGGFLFTPDDSSKYRLNFRTVLNFDILEPTPSEDS